MQTYDHPFAFTEIEKEIEAQLAIMRALTPLDGATRRRVIRMVTAFLEQERALTREERFIMNEPPEVVADLPRKR